jgi:HK97 gp10 family phage protein
VPTFNNQVQGFEKLTKQLSSMAQAAGGKALRSAARSAMLPAKKAAKSAAPVGTPPYTYEGVSSGPAATNYGGGVSVDPYPRKLFKTGQLVSPGWTARHVIIKTKISRDKRNVRVFLGVDSNSWFAVSLIELGTSRIAARPWLEPAFRRSLGAINTRFKAALKTQIDKASRI